MNYKKILENDDKSVLDESSGIVRNFFLTFIILDIYVLSVVAATTDYQLLVPDGKVHLFIFNFEVSLLKFYIFSPLLLTIVHLNLLMNICEHQFKLRSWSLEFGVDSKKISLRPFFLNYYYFTSLKDKYHKYVLTGILYITVFILPLFVLINIQWKFSKYHNTWITGWHFLLIFIELLLTFYYAKKILRKDKLFFYRFLALAIIAFNLFNLLIVFLINQDFFYTKPDLMFFRICKKIVLADYAKLPQPANSLMETFMPSMRLEVRKQNLFKKRTTEELFQQYMGERIKLKKDRLIGWLDAYEGLDLQKRNLQFADFRGSKLFKAKFTDTRLHEASFDLSELYCAEFNNSQIRNTTFEKAILEQASFNDATLHNASFHKAVLPGAMFKSSVIRHVDFKSAQLQQANFYQARLYDETFLNKADMTGSNLSHAEFFNANCTETIFTNSKLNEASFSKKCRLAKSIMKDADLSYARFKDVNCFYTNFQFADLSNTSFENMIAIGANFVGARLNQTVFKNIEIKKANFTGTNLIDIIPTNIEWDLAIRDGALFLDSFSNENIVNMINKRREIACQNEKIAIDIAHQYSNMYVNDMFMQIEKKYSCDYLLKDLRKYIIKECDTITPFIEKIQCQQPITEIFRNK